MSCSEILYNCISVTFLLFFWPILSHKLLCQILYSGWGSTLSHAFRREGKACKGHWNCSVGFICFYLSQILVNDWSFIHTSQGIWRHVKRLSFIVLNYYSQSDPWFPFCSYAICGDATIKKFALVRPSTRARLANIDGVNQVCRLESNYWFSVARSSFK